MSQNSEFLARVLRNGSRAYAAYAAGELLDAHPEAKKGLAPDPFAAWQGWLAVRVEELAAAVAAERPELFSAQVVWAKGGLVARGMSLEHFRASLVCLRQVLLQELPEQVQALAARYLDEAIEVFDERATDLCPPLLPNTPYGRLAAAYLLALLQGDRRGASRVVLDALDQHGNVCDMYLHVLLPAQQEIGRMWVTGEVSVAEEHFCSQTTKMVMSQLLARAEVQPPNGKTVLAAAVAGDQHDVGLCAVADFFEMAGWRTILLGADVPVDEVVRAVECFHADLLALSASLSVQIPFVKATIQAVRAAPCGDAVKILVGGLAFCESESLPSEMGADGYAASADQAVRLGGQLVGLPAG